METAIEVQTATSSKKMDSRIALDILGELADRVYGIGALKANTIDPAIVRLYAAYVREEPMPSFDGFKNFMAERITKILDLVETLQSKECRGFTIPESPHVFEDFWGLPVSKAARMLFGIFGNRSAVRAWYVKAREDYTPRVLFGNVANEHTS